MIRTLEIYFGTFLRHLTGIVGRPYETYRELALVRYPLEAVFLIIGITGYLAWVSLIRKGIHPFFVTLHFGKLFWGVFFTFIFAWGILYFVGRLFGGKGKPRSLFLPWAYSLLPTLVWFFLTSLLYIVLPPPRTKLFSGQLFSIIYIAISLTLFYWKTMLYYLTLRFGHKLDLIRIILVSLITFPIGGLYSLLVYKLGIFRVPFL
jgi:hypothetical protein